MDEAQRTRIEDDLRGMLRGDLHFDEWSRGTGKGPQTSFKRFAFGADPICRHPAEDRRAALL